MAHLNTDINGRIFFSIYTFQTEPDKMALTFSLRCGMLIVGSWTVCLFFIYFLHVSLTAMCQMRIWKENVHCLVSWESRSWHVSPHPKRQPPPGTKNRVTCCRRGHIFVFFHCKICLSLQWNSKSRHCTALCLFKKEAWGRLVLRRMSHTGFPGSCGFLPA